MGSAYEFDVRICGSKDQYLRPLSYDDRHTIRLIQTISQSIKPAILIVLRDISTSNGAKKEYIAKCFKFTVSLFLVLSCGRFSRNMNMYINKIFRKLPS